MKIFVVLIILTGCSLAPCYNEPDTETPESWKEEIVVCKTLPAFSPWWTLFEDDNLNTLEEIALNNSPTLDSAYYRVVESRAIADSIYADLFPSFRLAPTTLNSGILAPLIRPPVRVHYQQYTFPLTGSYEIDLFGRIRNGYYAASANADALYYAYEGIKLSLTSDVALNYFLLRSLDAQIEVLERTIVSRKDAFDVNTARFESGLVNYSDVSRAENQLTTAKADLALIQLLRARAENILATLIGTIASNYCAPYDPLTKPSPAACPSFPSELIERRPDIAQAERRLAAANALIGVARTGFFPSFQISGAIGYQSPNFSHLFDWHARLWQWATQTSQLIFDAGKTSALTEAAEARYFQELGNYSQTVLVAFQEVESALAAERLIRESHLQLAFSVRSARETRSISQERYLQGLVTYLDVTEADRSLLIDELRFAQSRLETYRATIELIKAIGGGFDRCEEDTY